MVYRLEVVWTGLAGAPYLSTFHALDATVDRAAFAADVATFLGSVSLALVDDIDWEIQSEVKHLDTQTGALLGVETVPTQSGSGGSIVEPLPPSNQALIRWRTGGVVGGRRVLGKSFVPGYSEDAAVGGRLAPSTQSGLQSAADALVTNANGALCVWSRPKVSEAGAVIRAGSEHPVTGASVWSEFAVLRSRRD